MVKAHGLLPLAVCLAAPLWGCAAARAPVATPQLSALAPPSEPLHGPRLPEQLSYTITHSLAGHVGDLEFAVAATRGAQGQLLWNGTGKGGGSFLGFGSKSHFSTTFDPGSRQAHAWTLHRDTGSAVIIDEASQAQLGVVSTHRQRSDQPEEWATLNSGGPTYDPLGFLLGLRTHGEGAWTAQVLEGRALWNVTATPQQVETIQWAHKPVQARRYQLHALPLDWHLVQSKTRNARIMTVWLSNTPERTPLVLKAPAPLGEVRVELKAPAPKLVQR